MVEVYHNRWLVSSLQISLAKRAFGIAQPALQGLARIHLIASALAVSERMNAASAKIQVKGRQDALPTRVLERSIHFRKSLLARFRRFTQATFRKFTELLSKYGCFS